MIASLKVANVAYLALLKLAAAKSLIGVGVLVGGAATGLVATDALGPDYVNGATLLINQSIDAEAGISTKIVSLGVGEVDGGAPAAAIPQLVITAQRMSRAEKLAYDAQRHPQVLATQH
jgi:hypothetical protein